MARKVKLQDTGEYGMSTESFRAPSGKYYSSEENYNKVQKNLDYKDKCIKKMFSLLGYKPGMIIPTYFYKDLKSFEGVGFEALYDTMVANTKAVEWALNNKQFTTETAKIMYIMAIFKNNVMDSYKKIVERDKALNVLKEKENNMSIENIELNNTTKKGNDISSLLGGEDWI